ncbi:hypothetical protein LUZ60_013206 [Juncus effusus]|nr:hypothetical protein LUZ60_013206 [Juncus effusus]
MSSKKEEERNEKIIRGLLKLPPNRRCINCNGLGPQYVCTNFWTFICITCSGIHREFTHRVKSVSMAKFTSQEVDALQRGGNQRAREMYLKDYDPMQLKFPDSRNVEKIREFIKSVYVDKKYAGERNSERPPRDLQNNKKNTEDLRRASSYHSYSQSPPYDFQYEDRINGKKQQNGILSRKPGSDRGNYEGKLASFLSLPINQQEEISDERIGNRSPGFRSPDLSNGNQSPGFGIPDFEDSNGNGVVNGSLRSNRTASCGSVGSFDSVSIKSADSNNDNFDELIMQKSANNSKTNIDLFSQPSENIGWATFDSLPVKNISQTNDFHSKKEKFAPLTELFPAHFSNPNLPSNENTKVSEVWSAFEDLNVNATHAETFTGFEKTEDLSATSNISQNWFSFEDTKSTQIHTVTDTDTSLIINNPFANDEISEISSEDWVPKLSIINDNFAASSNPFDALTLTESNNSTEDNTPINPFDLPFDGHSEALNMFMDKALPDFHISNAFHDNLFPPQSALPNLNAHANSPFMNMVAPTAVSSGSGNPFA